MAKTIVVADDTAQLPSLEATVLDFTQYLSEYPKINEGKTRVINLCNTEAYLSQGYHCSLLAEARQHQVMPSVSTINDLAYVDNRAGRVVLTLPRGLIKPHEVITDKPVMVYFGWCEHESASRLASYLFVKFPSPILRVLLDEKDGQWQVIVQDVYFQNLSQCQQQLFFKQLDVFTRKVWRSQSRKKYRWDMAILVNPEERTPPSDKVALNKFVRAAEQHGIRAELVTHEQIDLLNRYDALFIRETTAIRNHTYALSRRAEQEGLVVMDDPTSILRCCNKVFLQDAFSYNKVPAPKTQFVTRFTTETIGQLEQSFGYPMVLKLPESAFSLGVFKAKDRNSLEEYLAKLLKESALVLVQEYLYTEFDWRIGVLNGRALYACRYHMARNHWQIYNHGAKRSSSGGFDTMPTFEVPKIVLDAAIKACSFIGNSLYGVDLKQIEDKVYVIEVNDNPSIESKVEDKYLGDELYMQIMQEFADRLEVRGKE